MKIPRTLFPIQHDASEPYLLHRYNLH